MMARLGRIPSYDLAVGQCIIHIVEEVNTDLLRSYDA